VTDAAIRHPEIAAVIAQTPFMDGLVEVLGKPAWTATRLFVDGLVDKIRQLRGRPPRLVAVAAPPGGYAVFADAHAWSAISVLIPADSTWRNEVAARFALASRFIALAARETAPVPGADPAGRKRAPHQQPCRQEGGQRAPRAEVREYDGLEHFDVYHGEGFERLVADQVAFLQAHVPVSDGHG